MKKEKADLLVVGNLVVNNCKREGGVNPHFYNSYTCYANKEDYEADKVVVGDYTLDGEAGVIVATGNVVFMGEGV